MKDLAIFILSQPKRFGDLLRERSIVKIHLISGSNHGSGPRMMTYGLGFNEIAGENVLARFKSTGGNVFRCAVSGVK